MKSPYDVIVKQIITEKTVKMIESEDCPYGKYTFEVAKGANKVEVKKAVEIAFDVKVKDVNIINVRKKARRMGKYEGFAPAVRKAIVTLEKGFTISAFEI